MTTDEIKKYFPHASGSTLRRNPAGAAPLAAGPAEVTQSRRRCHGADRGVDGSAPGVGCRVTLIQCRRRLLDAHDNLAFAVKPTVDAITAWLGFTDDADPRLQFEYGQQQTRGAEGLIVKIEMLC